jgi:hypothetical protein
MRDGRASILLPIQPPQGTNEGRYDALSFKKSKYFASYYDYSLIS